MISKEECAAILFRDLNISDENRKIIIELLKLEELSLEKAALINGIFLEMVADTVEEDPELHESWDKWRDSLLR